MLACQLRLKYSIVTFPFSFLLFMFFFSFCVSKHMHTSIKFSHSFIRFIYASCSRLYINEILSLVLYLNDEF